MQEYFLVVILSLLNMTCIFRDPQLISLRINDSVQIKIFTKYLSKGETN